MLLHAHCIHLHLCKQAKNNGDKSTVSCVEHDSGWWNQLEIKFLLSFKLLLFLHLACFICTDIIFTSEMNDLEDTISIITVWLWEKAKLDCSYIIWLQCSPSMLFAIEIDITQSVRLLQTSDQKSNKPTVSVCVTAAVQTYGQVESNMTKLWSLKNVTDGTRVGLRK